MAPDPKATIDDAAVRGMQEVAVARLRGAGAGPDDLARLRWYGERISRVVPGVPYLTWPADVLAVRDDLRSRGGAALVAAFHRCVVLDRIAASRPILAAPPFDSGVADCYEDAVAAILTELFDAADGTLDFPNDGFAKDVSVVALRLWPFGAQTIEPRMGIGRRLLIAGGPRSVVAGLGALLRAGGNRPFYETHTYTRTVHLFTEEGRRDGFLRIARVMAREPFIKGVFSSAWYWDPRLVRISPRLAYIRVDPLRAGATIIRVPNTAQTVELATMKSSTRRQLYERGDYMPRQYLMIWPRAGLLAWAGLS